MQVQTATEKRLQLLLDERARVQTLHEELLKEVGDNDLSDVQKTQAVAYRERAVELDTEISELEAAALADRSASERSREIRRAMAGRTDGIDADEDGVVYRTMAAYARDVILTGHGRVAGQIQAQVGDKTELQRAQERLELIKRAPANTLSSNVGGLIPPQHIAQIFQVIDTSRPLVESAGNRVGLDRGTVTYPVVSTPPVVAVQSAEKSEAGNTGMVQVEGAAACFGDSGGPVLDAASGRVVGVLAQTGGSADAGFCHLGLSFASTAANARVRRLLARA